MKQKSARHLLDQKSRKEVRAILAQLARPVRLVLFTQGHACDACRQQQQLLEEMASLSDRLSLETRELVADAEAARELGIDKVPATAVIGEKDHGIRFYGVTSGYEFGSLLDAVAMVGSGVSGLDPGIEAIALLIGRPVRLEILVTLACPYCPRMVRLAHQIAFVNDQVRAEMVDAAEFPQLVQRYQVSGVPRTVVNERPAFEGALPPLDALLAILKEVEPEEYERLDAALRELRGERKAGEARPEREYDLIIVGAGPAAMAAAIYAARKKLDVALLGEAVGGQVTNTATVENWLGLQSIRGPDLVDLFRRHVEQYAIAERLHVQVEAVERTDTGFRVRAGGGTAYSARSVVLCTGKRYRRLGIPGESRFLGRGIAFCATCDAPLYRDKRVAVVGGGNSAFTAARDLSPYAREIHVIDVAELFRADAVLVEEVRQAPQVRFHTSMHVREFLGQERLSGLRLESADGRTRIDLPVDGVFLEIGLEANSEPVAGLVGLNERGEIPVDRNQSTVVPGLFAAGDVTDEPEKQIVVAAGAGAKAALAAFEYLAGQRRALRT